MEVMPEINNIIIDNILSQEQIDHIYNKINSSSEEESTVKNTLGHRAYFVGFDQSLISHLEKIICDHYGEGWRLNAMQFARYSNEYGYQPKLFPHYDDAFDHHKLTLDIQIKANAEWAIVVEGKPFILKDNQGLVFSGTDQIHWREDKILKDGEFFDMLFCHLEKDDKVSEEWKQHMELRQDKWSEKVQIARDSIEL